MARSETDIVNVGLRLIAGDRITSLDEGSNNANIASDLYEPVRDELLRSHTWRFATKLVKLVQLATDPTFEYDNAFGLPDDWMRTIAVFDNDAGAGGIWYEEAEIAGVGAIMANSETVFLKYVYTLTDTNRMTAGFAKALSTALARDMALPIGNSNTMREKYEKQATKDLNRAKSTDSLSSPARQRPMGSWVNNRFNRPSSVWPR